MNQQAKLGLIILALLTLLGLGGAYFFYQRQQQTLGKLRQTEQRARQMIQELQQQAQELQDHERELVDQIKTLEERMAVAGDDVAHLNGELAVVKGDLGAAREQLTALHNERDALVGQLQGFQAGKQGLERTLTQVRQEKSALEQAVADLKQHVAVLEEDNQRLKDQAQSAGSAQHVSPWGGGADLPLQPTGGAAAVATPPGTVALPPIVVQRATSINRPVGLTAKVISVNAPHQFVVVDKGAVDGVMVGDRFALSRGRRALGSAVAIRVRETIAACDTRALEAQPRMGDVVTLQTP